MSNRSPQPTRGVGRSNLRQWWPTRVALLALIPLAACQSNRGVTASPATVGGTAFAKAEVMRALDPMGGFHDDKAYLTTPADVAQIAQYFPEINTGHLSALHNSFNPSIVIDFQRGDGSHVLVASDYHLYHDDAGHGDFVVNGDPGPAIDQIFAAQAAADTSKKAPDLNAPNQ